MRDRRSAYAVIPAQAGIQPPPRQWIPACAVMTVKLVDHSCKPQ